MPNSLHPIGNCASIRRRSSPWVHACTASGTRPNAGPPFVSLQNQLAQLCVPNVYLTPNMLVNLDCIRSTSFQEGKMEAHFLIEIDSRSEMCS